MRNVWIPVCLLVAAGGCKTEPAAPAEGEPTARAAESATPAEPPPTDVPAKAPEEPVAEPDPDAPSDVAAPPADANRTDSGLAWKRLKKGKGKRRPGRLDTVVVKYTGWTTSGQRFDSTESRGSPMVVSVNHLIHGFAEGVQMMVPGEKRRLWIPGTLAYGEAGSGEPLAPQQPLGMLVFDVELVSFSKAPEVPAAPEDVGRIPEDAERSDSGLAWRVLKTGSGTEHPTGTSVVVMDFTMWTADGEVVDSTALRGRPNLVGTSRLVPGWKEAIKLMVEGERRLLWIPEDLAFRGSPGRPQGMVVVDVTLLRIDKALHKVR